MFIVGLFFIIVAYLVGSLSSAVIVCKAMNLPDPRSEGSGNPGATNVLRIGGKNPAIMVLVGDVLKGLLPALLAAIFGVQGFMLAMVVLAAVVGHMFPMFFKFEGGKGVATALGGMLVLSFWLAILAVIVWAVVVFITRYVSLASLISVVLVVVLMLFVNLQYFLPIAVMAFLIIWRHMENIERLRAGTESKIDFEKDFKQ